VGSGGPHPGSAVNPEPVFRLPWYSVFSFVNAGTPLGIAQGAVRDFRAETRRRAATYSGKALADLATLQMRLAEAATLVDAAETVMIKDCDEAMALVEAAHVPDLIDRARWRRDGAYAAQLCARAVDIVFAGAGGGAIHEAHPLQRALRDVHAANGHIGVSWELNGGIYGRVALGLPPEFPL
jgi:3-hydroxy-9,10-secoandrosta-1,3,5(10)-triene-9,17-dione monooxygenase